MARAKENRENEQAPERHEGQALQQQGGGERGQQSGLARRSAESPSLLSGSPFAFMRRFGEEMDRLFEDFGFGRAWLAPSFGREFFPAGFGEVSGGVWSPQVEVFNREGQFVVRADLPGMSKDDVKVEITDDALVIEGERKSEHEEKREGYYRSERSYGTFRRRIPLPEGVNAEGAGATFHNGVLEITMQAPQREQARTRRIEIKDASGGEQAGAKAAGRG